jgi:hypothetical protein
MQAAPPDEGVRGALNDGTVNDGTTERQTDGASTIDDGALARPLE